MYRTTIGEPKAAHDAIARRRREDEERKRRFFNPRLRNFGVDTHVLTEQINEKQEKERLEAEREAAFGGCTTPSFT